MLLYIHFGYREVEGRMQASYRRALQPGPATCHPHLAAGDLPDAVRQMTSQPSTERVQLGR